MIVDNLVFENLQPAVKYAPWASDQQFKAELSKIAGHTLVDQYRCYELWELVGRAAAINPNAHFIEIGVWRGGTAALIAKKLSILSSQATLYLADTFSGVVKATEKDASYHGGEHADTSVEVVTKLLSGKYDKIKILQGIFPEETSQYVDNQHKFVFCHIDVDVYQSAKDIVDWIWDKLVVGGIIVFDDYGFPTCTGVTKYVNEQDGKPDRLIIYNINGHAIMIKIS
jgi:O-methyltransferase